MSDDNSGVYSLWGVILSAVIIFMVAIVVIMIACAFAKNNKSNACTFINNILDKIKGALEFNVVTNAVASTVIATIGAAAPIIGAKLTAERMVQRGANGLKNASSEAKAGNLGRAQQEIGRLEQSTSDGLANVERMAGNAENSAEAEGALNAAKRARAMSQAAAGNTADAAATLKEVSGGGEEMNAAVLEAGSSISASIDVGLSAAAGTAEAAEAAEVAGDSIGEGAELLEDILVL
jgi:hypothetical protein